jgi:hypothetical protein
MYCIFSLIFYPSIYKMIQAKTRYLHIESSLATDTPSSYHLLLRIRLLVQEYRYVPSTHEPRLLFFTPSG